MLAAGPGSANSGGEIFACAYSLDGAYLLSGGWDGQLRLWDTSSLSQVTSFKGSDKPIAACAPSHDGKQWLSGGLDGMLATWECNSHNRLGFFLAHTRPISAIVFSPDGQLLATSSWDSNLILWKQGRNRESRILSGHSDIVSGCGFTPDGQRLISWSYDCTIRIWEIARYRTLTTLNGHSDRITAGAVSPDGKWIVSGARNGSIKLWSTHKDGPEGTARLPNEIRSCFFLTDAESVVVIDAQGRIGVYGVPDLSERSHLLTRAPIQCAQLNPTGNQIALGTEGGKVLFVSVEGLDAIPLSVTATLTSRQTATRMQRLFGKSQLTHAYAGTCPACRQPFELSNAVPGQAAPCPHCCRNLRLSAVLQGTV